MYQPQMKARDYQEEGLRRLKGREAFALLMAMRTGKTKVLLDDFGRLELAGELEDLLVIAPAGVYRTWEEQIQLHCSVDLLSRLRVGIWVSGAGTNATKELKNFLGNETGPRIFLMNVEALSSVKSAREAAESFLTRRAMIAIDESTIIKNPKAKRTKYINTVLAPKANARRILSGLPTPRSPLDLFCQFEFLDWRILRYPNYYIFRRRYAIEKELRLFGRRPFKIVVGYRHQEELQQLIEPFSFRVPFRPNIPSTYSIREVFMTEKQADIYKKLKTMATAQLSEEGSHVTATSVITQILRLHQVLCGQVPDEIGIAHEVPENRTATLLELLDDYAGKTVIWCSYDASVRKICEALAKEYPITNGAGEELPTTWPHPHIARFWGGNANTREEEERRFKTDPNCRFMVATPAAGGWGRTWDVADLVVYYSSTYNLEHREQSEQRVQGVAKTRQVDYIDLITPGTVDEKILTVLRKKIDMATAITGDNWKEWVI